MKLLAIDTSTELATVALFINGQIFSEEQGSVREHAQFLLPMIERLLALAGIKLAQLDGIVFGCGPGSFTGLRIACSVAKALAYAHDLPLYPVSSLAAIAYNVYHTEIDLMPNVRVLAMIDARMQQVYWAEFTADLDMKVVEQVMAVTDISLETSTPLILAGVGFEAYAAQLPAAIQALVVAQKVIFPTAEAMIGLVRLGRCKPVSAEEALPVYVRNQVTQGGAGSGSV